MTTATDGDTASDVPAPLGRLVGPPARRGARDPVPHPCPVRRGGVRLRDEGFETCADLCAVDYLDPSRGAALDYLTHPAALPEGVAPERFEVVVNLLSLSQVRRVRVRVQVPADDAEVPTLFDLYPGTEAMEREAYDLFGIVFTGHPDMTRILLPEDWEGHPLRKDYGVGRVPVQFKGAPGPR